MHHRLFTFQSAAAKAFSVGGDHLTFGFATDRLYIPEETLPEGGRVQSGKQVVARVVGGNAGGQFNEAFKQLCFSWP